ncbi:MAG TPA: AmmeMemoRadiSam system protein B [Phycisphaerae bacterium]|nr:AmmeMemoRadiSam system protein B [Phycisphaerae bacterium]
MKASCLLQGGMFTMAILTSAHGQSAPGGGSDPRPARFSGSWYPGDSAELATLIDQLLDRAPVAKLAGKPRAVIAPHAGYRFSAPVAAAGYRCLRGQSYKRVIALAFSHRYAHSYRGIDVPDKWTAYRTPLGDVPIDTEAVKKLKGKSLFASHPGVDADEHSLELQVPFLQRALKDFKLVPLLVGKMSVGEHAAAAAAILPLLDSDTLLVVSSDCTHFGPNYGYEPFRTDIPAKLKELADKASAAIEHCDFDGFTKHLVDTDDTICGREPILLLMRVLSMQGGALGIRTAFDTSGRMTNDYENSVTYQSFVFTARPGALPADARAAALKLARATVAAVLSKKDPPRPDLATLPAALREKGACFVTLQNRGQLRGCIGNMEARGPLVESVIHNAISAATEDYRFADNPVTVRELDDLHIEISYLTPMKPVGKVEEIIVGRHGVLIESGSRRAVFLPQVAYERGWTRDEFLTQLCVNKAGLPADAWKRPEAKLYSFEAEVFGESKPTTKPADSRD